MAKETLFRILMRQPWWVTLLVALSFYGIGHLVFPPIAPFLALPFFVFAIYIAWTQARHGSPVDAGKRLDELREMSWEGFSAILAAAYRNQGYEVTSSDGAGYDFRLVKNGRVTLLQCRRWKVNQVGAGQVRELTDAIRRAEAYNGVCVSAGVFSEPARKLAAAEPVTLVAGTELVALSAQGRKKPLWRFVR